MSTVTISAGAFTSRSAGVRTVGVRAASLRAGDVRAAAPRRRSSPVRLTRRGRLVTTLVLLVAFLAGGVVAAGDLASAGTEPGAAATATRITVQPGDTLWTIAEQEAPGT